MQIQSLSAPRIQTPAAVPAGTEGMACPLPDSFERIDPGYQLDSTHEAALKQALTTFKSAAARPYYDATADGAARDRYYASIADSLKKATPQEAYKLLNNLVTQTHTTPLDYNPSGNLYPWVDLHPDMKLYSIYSQHSFSAPEAIKADLQSMQKAAEKAMLGGAAMPGGGEALGATTALYSAQMPYNCEHVVPQSWFDKRSPMRGDLHHLFACEPGCNSARGSRMYFDSDKEPHQTLPNCGRASDDNQYFDPLGGKGAVARATLYFMMRYPGYVGDRTDEYQPKDIATLVKWSQEFPPDEYEKHRNAAIQEMQGNRNPLIDFPELVNRIDFSQGLGKPH